MELRTLACLGLLMIGTTVSANGAFSPLQPGDAVPTYTLKLLSGAPFVLGGEQPMTLVNVWATWCGPCREEFPDLERIYSTYRARGLRFVAISVDRDGVEKVRRFTEKRAVSFPVALDDLGAFQTDYRTQALPETLLIDVHGRLVWRHAGALTDSITEVRSVLDASLP